MCQERWTRLQAKDRQEMAQKWRQCRQRIREYPEPIREALLAFWQRCRWPADPTYFLSMLHMFDQGRLAHALTESASSRNDVSRFEPESKALDT